MVKLLIGLATLAALGGLYALILARAASQTDAAWLEAMKEK